MGPLLVRMVFVRIHRSLPALLAAASAAALPVVARAQFQPPPQVEGLPGEELPVLIARIVQYALILVAVIALAFIVWSGFRYITSQGEEQVVEEAKRGITYAVVGIVFIGLAYAIVEFVIRAVIGR